MFFTLILPVALIAAFLVAAAYQTRVNVSSTPEPVRWRDCDISSRHPSRVDAFNRGDHHPDELFAKAEIHRSIARRAEPTCYLGLRAMWHHLQQAEDLEELGQRRAVEERIWNNELKHRRHFRVIRERRGVAL